MSAPRPVLLMVRALDVGGTERQLAQIVKALDRSRFTPHVGCFHAAGLRGDELRAAGIPILELPVRSFYSLSAVTGALEMGRYVRQHGIELVHAFDVPMNSFAVPAARLAGVRVVIASQRAHRALTPGIKRHSLRLTDRMVDAIVVNSASVARELIDEDHLPRSLIRVCRNGIDTKEFQRREGPRDAMLIIGTLCALRPEKNLPALLRAVREVRSSRAGVKLLIVGSGPELPRLMELAQSLEVTDDCTFEKATSDVPRWLSAMDVFVLPSLSESASNSLMEAMACGCCVMASRVGGNPELVRDGETGVLFDPGELAGKLRELVDDPEIRASMGYAARREIEREFSLEMAARRMGEIYDQLR